MVATVFVIEPVKGQVGASVRSGVAQERRWAEVVAGVRGRAEFASSHVLEMPWTQGLGQQASV